MKPKPFPIDQTLTPENATQRGYTFVCDMFPDFVQENRQLIHTLLTEGQRVPVKKTKRSACINACSRNSGRQATPPTARCDTPTNGNVPHPPVSFRHDQHSRG